MHHKQQKVSQFFFFFLTIVDLKVSWTCNQVFFHKFLQCHLGFPFAQKRKKKPQKCGVSYSKCTQKGKVKWHGHRLLGVVFCFMGNLLAFFLFPKQDLFFFQSRLEKLKEESCFCHKSSKGVWSRILNCTCVQFTYLGWPDVEFLKAQVASQ